MANPDYGTSKKTERRDIRYIGREFSTIRANLLEYAKSYFPTAYNDFNESSPGMMFIEMASYVGDVLSFYQDISKQHKNYLKKICKLDNRFSIKNQISDNGIYGAQNIGFKFQKNVLFFIT